MLVIIIVSFVVAFTKKKMSNLFITYSFLKLHQDMWPSMYTVLLSVHCITYVHIYVLLIYYLCTIITVNPKLILSLLLTPFYVQITNTIIRINYCIVYHCMYFCMLYFYMYCGKLKPLIVSITSQIISFWGQKDWIAEICDRANYTSKLP